MDKTRRQNQAKGKKAAQHDQPKSRGSAILNTQTGSSTRRKPRKIPEPRKPLYDDEIPQFRQFWERLYGGYFGSFEDTTVVPPMCYTLPGSKCAVTDNTLQIFSIKIAKEEKDLNWPMHVFGLIAIRDSIDPRRNLIFQRDRDNCQTINEE
ncbi:hypothetical protein EJB05_18528, partial [Eragrostis curvula]